jgi:hypothetical protein
MGAEFIENDWHKGEVTVERRGLLHPKYIFYHKGKDISELVWQRARVGRYKGKGIDLELQVGALGKTILAKDEMSRLSRLTVKSPLNPRKAKMLIELADSDGFIVHQRCDNIDSGDFSLHVSKKHYITNLIDFHFSLYKKRTRTIARINVAPIMRWEAQHFHHLMALVMARIAFVQEHDLHRHHQSKFLRERVSIGKCKWQSI